MSGKEFHLLIPGRHHLITQFQIDYIIRTIQQNISNLLDFDGNLLTTLDGKIKDIIFAITSSNHKYTKRNPISGTRRAQMLEYIFSDISLETFIYNIEDLGSTDRFADFIIKKINLERAFNTKLSTENTIVATSTAGVANLFKKMGFNILPLERDYNKKDFSSTTPRELLSTIESDIKESKNILCNENIKKIHPRCINFLHKYNIRDDFKRIYSDYIVNREGGLTDTRDYNTYGRSFEESSKRKYLAIKDDIKPGVIVDIGCCTGDLLKYISHDSLFHDSDLYGTDIVPDFINICESKLQHKEFGNENCFFLPRNIIDQKLFPENTINTAISFALTHEVISYDSLEKLKTFILLLYEQIDYGGRWINYDVIGPEEPNKIIKVKLATDDGNERDENKCNALFALAQLDYNKNKLEWIGYVKGLSTYARFKLFTMTFRYKQKDRTCDYKETDDGYIIIKSKDIAEFIYKKDYHENRISEMNEFFCTYNFDGRKKLVEELGFQVNPKSELIYNDRIYDNRFKGKVTLYDYDTHEQLPYFATNIKLICDKKM